MKLYEWELEFDILYNNISSNKAPGLNVLEKSIILTEAQEDVVKSLYLGTTGADGFESTEASSEYLKTLVKEKKIHPTDESMNLYKLPDDLWFIIYEGFDGDEAEYCDNDVTRLIPVYPVTHDEFSKVAKNPFRGPNKRRVLRKLIGNVAELTFNEKYYSTGMYYIRYLSKPDPIILPGCNEYAEIAKDGYYHNFWTDGDEGQNCKLPESLHRTILLRAIQIAKALWA